MRVAYVFNLVLLVKTMEFLWAQEVEKNKNTELKIEIEARNGHVYRVLAWTQK